MVIHFIAFWFFAYGFFTLAFLHDYNFLHVSSDHMLLLNDKGRFIKDKELIRQGGNFGLLAGYVISWFLSSKRNWHWINSAIIFILAFALYNLGYLGWNIYHSAFQIPGKLFADNSIGQYLTNGLFLVAIGLGLFFTKGIIRYIDRGNKSVEKAAPGDKKAVKVARS